MSHLSRNPQTLALLQFGSFSGGLGHECLRKKSISPPPGSVSEGCGAVEEWCVPEVSNRLGVGFPHLGLRRDDGIPLGD